MAKNASSGIFSLIIGIVGFIILYNTCSGDSDNDKYDNILTKVDAGKAYSISQEFVKAKLKSPSSSSFPYYDDNFGTDLGDSNYIIISYFDATNSFGAKIRTHYTCELKYISGDWSYTSNWQLIHLSFR